MALVPLSDNPKRNGGLRIAERVNVRYALPAITEKIPLNYEAIKQLCNSSAAENGLSKEEAHQAFMKNYHKIFAKTQKSSLPPQTDDRNSEPVNSSLVTTVPTQSTARKSVSNKEETTPAKKLEPIEQSHDIRHYLPMLHQERKTVDPEKLRNSNLNTLRKLLKKLPFERSSEENDQICAILKQFPNVMQHFSKRLLKELVTVAQLDSWKDPEITIFGNTGLHMILRGTVRALTLPYIRFEKEPFEVRSPTPILQSQDAPVLRPGSCFGTLIKVEGRAVNSRVLNVITLESNCDFLRISTSDYARVVESLSQREHIEKVGLLQSCPTFHLWSKQPITEIAALFEWAKFPANTVLVTEGLRAPFMAVIKSGFCHVLRQVDVMESLPGGKQRRKRKEVIVGKLNSSDAFGELSCATREPMVCSIITASPVELVCIDPQRLEELNEVTLQLLIQSSSQTFGHLSKNDVHEEYMNQELKCEWNEFKHNTVMDVINSRGVRPGYGKWAR